MTTVYLLQSGTNGPVKIGLTRLSVEKRIAQLQTGNPFPIRLIATIHGDERIEGHLHRSFGHLRLSGEWFSPDAAIFAAFEAACDLPSEPSTLPPTTRAGVDLLRGLVGSDGVQRQYPDGSRHSQIDWDELALTCDAAVAAYADWCGDNG